MSKPLLVYAYSARRNASRQGLASVVPDEPNGPNRIGAPREIMLAVPQWLEGTTWPIRASATPITLTEAERA